MMRVPLMAPGSSFNSHIMLNREIRALIVDDEEHNRNVLAALLAEYCPNITVAARAESADNGFKKINELQPDLVFLDIRMPGKSGFDLLQMFDEVKFEVIFVSAFNEYAVHAFDFNAVDYILKPIDYSKLTKAVTKASAKIFADEPRDILHFIKTLDEATSLIRKFSLHHNGKVVLVNVSEVEAIEAQTEYCSLMLKDGSHYNSYKSLKQFEDVLRPLGTFLRINKSTLVNTDLIKSYTKGEICIIELRSGLFYEVSRRKKAEILAHLKNNADQTITGT
jgi:two-component system, LytTR family, response regulator